MDAESFDPRHPDLGCELNEGADRRCETCLAWDRHDRAPLIDELDEDVPVPLDGSWGTCEAVVHASGRGGSDRGAPGIEQRICPEPIGLRAYLADGSGYFASLTTRHDFGCVLWTER